MSPPVPVTNVLTQPNGRLVAKSNGNLIDQLYTELREKKLEQFTAKQIQDMLRARGRSALSANYITSGLKERGLAKMMSPGQYLLNLDAPVSAGIGDGGNVPPKKRKKAKAK